MTSALEASISNLYAIFAQYPLRQDMDACPCCVSGENQKKLFSKTLRELEPEDISHYAWKAMTTWGDVEDFKHFLPRVLELMATTENDFDAGLILRKLTYASWQNWPTAEQDAVRTFVLAWWTERITQKWVNTTDFIGLYRLLGKLESLLHCWVIDFNDHSFRNLVYFIQGNYDYLRANKSAFKQFDPLAAHQLLNWIHAQKETLEQGFYHFEESDPAFAQQISDALYQLDWVPMPDPE